MRSYDDWLSHAKLDFRCNFPESELWSEKWSEPELWSNRRDVTA